MRPPWWLPQRAGLQPDRGAWPPASLEVEAEALCVWVWGAGCHPNSATNFSDFSVLHFFWQTTAKRYSLRMVLSITNEAWGRNVKTHLKFSSPSMLAIYTYHDFSKFISSVLASLLQLRSSLWENNHLMKTHPKKSSTVGWMIEGWRMHDEGLNFFFLFFF